MRCLFGLNPRKIVRRKVNTQKLISALELLALIYIALLIVVLTKFKYTNDNVTTNSTLLFAIYLVIF